LEKNYEDDDDEGKSESIKSDSSVESKLPLPTQRLVELIFNENHFNAALEDIGMLILHPSTYHLTPV
jgi:poly [ADP-ribose] polymerase 2/3/4